MCEWYVLVVLSTGRTSPPHLPHQRLCALFHVSRKLMDDCREQRALFRGPLQAMFADTVWPRNPFVAGGGGIAMLALAVRSAISQLWSAYKSPCCVSGGTETTFVSPSDRALWFVERPLVLVTRCRPSFIPSSFARRVFVCSFFTKPRRSLLYTLSL